jgi:hypothetical protein
MRHKKHFGIAPPAFLGLLLRAIALTAWQVENVLWKITAAAGDILL